MDITAGTNFIPMMNLDRILLAVMTAKLPDDLPPDSEACLECQYHKTNLKFEEIEGGQYCYMFKEIPDTLCMQFRKVNFARKQ